MCRLAKGDCRRPYLLSSKGISVKTPRALALLTVLALPAVAWTQESPPYEPTGPIEVSQFHPIASMAAEPPVIHTTCDGIPKPDPAAGGTCAPPAPAGRHVCWPQVWGTVGVPIYFAGNHMAPNGVPYHPLFALDFDFNIGLLPQKELYLFAENKFWTQRAGVGITNPNQGKWDFSKREYDLDLGFAWNFYDNFEFRVFAYALNNLNRGNSLSSPFGFKDGIGLEGRYYFGGDDVYDVGRLSFVSLGYYPSKSLAGGDGSEFHPGMFARAYLTYDLPWIRSYVYGDGQFIGERSVKARLLELDFGLAARPFKRLENLEFRIGFDVTGDVQVNTERNLFYGAIRITY
jgi:hypothetical protein